MVKRKPIVISSSDDEDWGLSSTSKSTRPKSKPKPQPKPRPSSVPRCNPKRARTTCISTSLSHSGKVSNPFDEIRLICQEFDEGFNGLKVPSGFPKSNKDLWIDKYRPCSLEDLAVHRKKVEELKIWFEERLTGNKDGIHNHVLLITGQAGVGKSAAVYTIASHFGATVCEWNTPIPTVWQEHLHNSNSGIRYMSKVDEFENFVERIRKYGLVSSSVPGEYQTSVVLLIDDLPVINGEVSYERIQRCLHLLLRTVCMPTVILITEYGKSDSTDYSTRCWEEIQSSLLSAGACKLAFNLITINSIKKMLSKICKEEHCNVTTGQIDQIAQASGGDIRHAITSLQYFSVKSQSIQASLISNGTPKSLEGEKLEEFSHLGDAFSSPFGKDETLSLFHALGKFLHNKREAEKFTASDRCAMLLRDKFVRLPLKMETPEKILCQAHGQARQVADFLHENVLDFLSEEAIEDAWVVASYLSDADFLLASSTRMPTRTFEAENMIQSAAASVSARGVLFGNSQPFSSRWHSIRRPKLWQLEQSLWHAKREMSRQRSLVHDLNPISDLSVIATEWKPAFKWLGLRSQEDFQNDVRQKSNMMIDDSSLGQMSTQSEGDDTYDEDIEDW